MNKKPLLNLIIIFALLVNLNNNNSINNNSYLNSSSDGQFIDHVFTFNQSVYEYDFNLYMIKFHKYSVYLAMVSPIDSINMKVEVFAPDDDGLNPTEPDHFIILRANFGKYNSLYKELTSYYTAANDGLHKIKITGTEISPNTCANIHIKFDDEDTILKENVIFEVDGFYNLKTRNYIFHLDDDILYGLKIARVHSWEPPEPLFPTRFVKVSAILYGPNSTQFILLDNVILEEVFSSESSYIEFGTSFKGFYNLQIYVELGSGVPTSNLAIHVFEKQKIGDGPEKINITNNDNKYNNFEIETNYIFIFLFILSIGTIVGLVNYFKKRKIVEIYNSP